MKAQIIITFDVEDEYQVNEIQAEIENALYSVDCQVADAYICSEDDEIWDDETDELQM